jgi:hypothetical protein
MGAMSHLVSTVMAAIALIGPVYAGLLDRLPPHGDYALLGMVMTGLAVGWVGGRKRPIE